MKTKSIFLLIIFLFVHYIAYLYVKSKFDDKVTQDKKLKYMVPPITYEDYFEFKDLDKFYGNLFDVKEEDLNLIKSEA
jgi:hypothetical protein